MGRETDYTGFANPTGPITDRDMLPLYGRLFDVTGLKFHLDNSVTLELSEHKRGTPITEIVAQIIGLRADEYAEVIRHSGQDPLSD